MDNNRYLWFTATTIPNYEVKVAEDLKAIRDNDNLFEIREVIVPMEKYTTAKGLEKERPKYPSYFYVKILVDSNDQPPTNIWHRIRNIKGCIGLLQRDKYMIGMDDFDLKGSLDLTDEKIAELAVRKNL